MKKILFVASEANPYIKTGGLADVVYSLPKALQSKNVDARVMIPYYKKIKDTHGDELSFKKDFSIQQNWREQHVGLFTAENEGVPYYFIDNEYFFYRDNVYGHLDEAEKYSYFQKAVLESIKHIDFKPDIIHFNDWHTGMLALLYHDQYKHQEGYEDIKFVYTIHNLKYQGIFNKHVLHDLLGLKGDYYHKNGVEFYGNVNFMKAGIVYSDITTTVSKTYANEITYPYFGYKLDGLLRAQGNKLVGIVNGIDYDSYNPATDDKIYENYTVDNYQENKVKNKLALQREMGLEENPDIPLIGIVTRLTEMKGLSLIRHIFDELMQLDLQLVLLGTGEEEIENAFRYFESQYPEKARSNIMFSNEMAHKIYAASDLYLMPSKFEPCGLSQLIALRYGTIPIVRETGGLNDTVEAYNIYTGEGNGFSFKNYNAHELLFTIKRALALYHNEKDKWHSLVEKALKSDNSWKHSAEEYLQLYNRL